MKLCDTCIYRNEDEYHKPCIVYRDDCEYYEREADMKAVIQIDVPNYQIGQEVSIYFKDTMMIKGIVQEPSETIHGSTYGGVSWGGTYKTQEPKTGHWIRMKTYEKWGCSECNTVFRFTFKEHDYCPNCGSAMKEE